MQLYQCTMAVASGHTGSHPPEQAIDMLSLPHMQNHIGIPSGKLCHTETCSRVSHTSGLFAVGCGRCCTAKLDCVCCRDQEDHSHAYDSAMSNGNI